MDPLQMLMQLLGVTGGTAAPTASPSQGSGLGSTISAVSPILQKILSLLSATGAGIYGQDELENLRRTFAQQQQAAQLALNPGALAKRTVMATLPLDKKLAYTVTQAADAATAGRGMSQSPGAVASAEASALAPYAQQNLLLGHQDAQFGFPYQYATQNPDYLSVLNQLNQYGRNSTYSLPGNIP